MAWTVSPPIFMLKPQHPVPQKNVIVFGDSVFKEVIQPKWDHQGGLSASMTGVLRRRELDTQMPGAHPQKELRKCATRKSEL